MNKLKLFILTLLAVPVFAGVGFSSPTYAATCADGQSQASCTACEGIGLTGGDCASEGRGIDRVLRIIINIISAIVGVVAVVMVIVSGFKYITSGGDANKVASAKNSLIYAIVGIVIVVLAQFLVHFVIGAADTANKTPDATPSAKVLYTNKLV